MTPTCHAKAVRHAGQRPDGRRVLAIESLGARLLLAGDLWSIDPPPEAECPASACGATYIEQVRVTAAPNQSVDISFTAPMAFESRIGDGTILDAITLRNLSEGPIDLSSGTFSHQDGSTTLSWAPAQPLPLGYYQVTVDGGQLRNQNGDALAGGSAGLVFAAPAFASESLIAEGQVGGDSFSVPSLVDWNQDGLPDLLIGEKTNSGEGKIRVYLNGGTAATPSFTEYAYVQGTLGDLVVSASGCLGVFPRSVDWDGDGLQDLLLGRADGGIEVRRNVNTESQPQFGNAELLSYGPTDAKQPIALAARATFDVIDWNADGRPDLVAGGFDGRIQLFINQSDAGSPEFLTQQFVQNGAADLVVPSGRASVAVADLDGDRRQDLVVGNTNGEVLFYANVGTARTPAFDGFLSVQVAGQPLDLTGTPRSRPFVGDVNADGMPDLLVGAQDGLVRLYEAAQWDTAYQGDVDVTVAGQPFTYTFEVAGGQWQNVALPLDVSGDGQVTADDVNLLFQELNAPTFHQQSSRLLNPLPDEGAPCFFDVDGDGYCAPLDVLKVINHLNANSGEGEQVLLLRDVTTGPRLSPAASHAAAESWRPLVADPQVIDHLMTGIDEPHDQVFWDHHLLRSADDVSEPLL